MDASFTTKRIPKLHFSPHDHTSFLGTNSKSKHLSPVQSLSRYTSLLNFSTSKSSALNSSTTKSRSLFYKEIAEICKRLDPSFKLDEEGTNCYSLIKETLNKAVDLVINTDEALKKQKKEVETDKKYIQEIQKNFAEIEEKLMERENSVKSREDDLEVNKKLNGNSEVMVGEDIETVLLDLQRQIDEFNRNAAEKENYLQSWAEKLGKKEKELENKQTELKTVEWNLKKSQLELSIINKEVTPKSECKSEQANALIRSLFLKKQEIDRQNKESLEEFRILKMVKKQVEEVIEKNIEERLMGLQQGITELEGREREIQQFYFEEGVEEVKKMNAAEELKRERDSYEKEKALKEKEAKVMVALEAYLKKLESVIFLIQRKETEIF